MRSKELLRLGRPAFATPAGALAREWLLTNGLGGFACGTIAQANTRRYHGLLVAALRPPLDRVVMVAKADARVHYRGAWYELACNEYADGTLAPLGFQYLADFRLEGSTPVWTFALGDALLEQRVWMSNARNETHVQYHLACASVALTLEVMPLCTYRDYHAHSRGRQPYGLEALDTGCQITAFPGARTYALSADGGRFQADPDWYWNFRHRLEAERGLDSDEDLFRPGRFHAELHQDQAFTLSLSAETDTTGAAAPSAQAAPAGLSHEQGRQAALLSEIPATTPAWIRRLTLAADQFLVARAGHSAEPDGTTVIAGYPWFGDWGRDTMIALPGLALATGRHTEAAAILRTFAQHLSQGMLPNRFPDDSGAPEYNSVDGTLWYFHAIAQYHAATQDLTLVRELYPQLVEVIDWHRRGTRYGIGVDPVDGLLRAGEAGVQLTWMDAKVGEWVVTPRIGKPVEINALWHYALVMMHEWSELMGQPLAARRYQDAAQQAAQSFRSAFWCGSRGWLYDVIDGPAGECIEGRRVDASLRPNQLFAVSLGLGLLDAARERAVVDACSSALLTPLGLRSLAPSDPNYMPYYRGNPLERDASYHQGTAWSWLLGPFALAHERAYGNAAHALELLQGIGAHLDEACLGSISEIFDGAAPHAARGCFAQAWSVAETLRAWHRLSALRQASRQVSTRHLE